MDFLFKKSHSSQSSLNEEKTQPTHCDKCGNRHIGQNCAARPSSFELKTKAKQVYLVGEWSKWQFYQALKKVGQDQFVLNKNLMVGTYQYKYIVDKVWMHDQSKPTVPDNFGGFNNIRQIQPMNANRDTEINATGQPCISIQTSRKGKQVKIKGSWDNWNKAEVMEASYNHLKNHQQFIIHKKLLPQTKYEFKLLIDGEVVIDPEYPLLKSPSGLTNWIIPSSELSGNERESDKSSKLKTSSFNPTQFIWKQQKIEWFPYYNIYGHKMCVVGDHLYVVGGVSRGSYKNFIVKISLDTFQCVQKWSFQSFQERAFPILKPYGNKLLIFGGVSNNLNLLDDYITFNTSTSQISAHPIIRGTPPSKRQKSSCVILRDIMVFFGGCSWEFDGYQYQLYNDVSILDIHEMKWVDNVNPEGTKPSPRYGHSATLFNDYMYVFGGCVDIEKETSVNQVWKLKLIAHQKPVWQQVNTIGIPPLPRYGHTANLIGQNFIAIFGGINSSTPLNDIFLLNTKIFKWIKPDISGGIIPDPRHFHHSCNKDDDIIVLGGKTGNGKNQTIYVLKSNLQGVQLNL